MATLTPAQVYALAREAGLDAPKAVVATAIAMAESGLRTDAVGDVGLQDARWGPSIGLWQVRSAKAETGQGTSRDATRLTDPRFNARAMVEISGAGGNWRPWSVYKSGSYRTNLAKVTAAATGVESDPTWRDKLAQGLAGIPGLSAAAGVVSGAKDAAEGALGALNPFAGWQNQVQGIGLKLVLTLGAAALVTAGAIRLVVPAAMNNVRQIAGMAA